MQLGNEGKTLTKRKMIKTCFMYFPVFTRELWGHVFFIFLFWMIKSQSLHMSTLKKKTDIKLRNGGSQRVQNVISKPSDTVVLCYLK